MIGRLCAAARAAASMVGELVAPCRVAPMHFRYLEMEGGRRSFTVDGGEVDAVVAALRLAGLRVTVQDWMSGRNRCGVVIVWVPVPRAATRLGP